MACGILACMANNKYTKEMLEPIIAKSQSWADVCRAVGIKPFTGAQTNLRNRARAFDIDTSHFLGSGHMKGKKAKNRVDVAQHLVVNSTARSGWVRQKLIEEKYKEAQCEHCGLDEWMGVPIPLELDHINSDHWDNRLENLQILCPNCHALKTSSRSPTEEAIGLGPIQ